jgi:DNA polymerase III epsilon subunit-like protein
MLITVLDTETTGLEVSKHEIIQFGAIRFWFDDNGDTLIHERIDINIKPKRLDLADSIALKVNGYTDEAWRDAKPMEEHLQKIKEIIEVSEFLLGQNLVFDLRFINKAFIDAGIQPPKFPKYIDTKFMADGLKKSGIIKSSSLEGICEHYNIKFKGRAHNALVDCERTMTAWLNLSKTVDMVAFNFYDKPYDPYERR